MTHSVTVFDPPLCCATGVCGVSVDPALARFVADLDHLRARGDDVRRFNLAQEPDAFAACAVVRGALATRGTACLPMVLVDGAVVSEGRYPDRAQLLGFASSEPQELAVRACCAAEPEASARVAGRGACCE